MCTHFDYIFSYLIKVVALLIFICCYQHVLVNKDIHKSHRRVRSNMTRARTVSVRHK